MIPGYGYCDEYEDRGKPCGVLAECPVCRTCWAHCAGHDDPDECDHGTPKDETCEACGESK